jgi:hypothetical protein
MQGGSLSILQVKLLQDFNAMVLLATLVIFFHEVVHLPLLHLRNLLL